jgi:hypothetical protein
MLFLMMMLCLMDLLLLLFLSRFVSVVSEEVEYVNTHDVLPRSKNRGRKCGFDRVSALSKLTLILGF